jgi:hypothetical protein
MKKNMDFFECHIIIPEHDFITCLTDGKLVFQTEAIASLKSLAEALWSLSFVESIQTELEPDAAATINELENGECPGAFPFAIVSEKYWNEKHKHIFSNITKVERNGLLLERD